MTPMTTGDQPAKTRKQEKMTEHENRDSNGRWLPGKTGNAAGRGMTNRQRISEKSFLDQDILTGTNPWLPTPAEVFHDEA